MAEPSDRILPMLFERRADMNKGFDAVDERLDVVDGRLGSIEAAQRPFKQALMADTVLRRLPTGEFEQRIEAPETKVMQLEKQE